MGNLKSIADNTTEFIKRYKNVKDVWTDQRGLEILSDLALILGCEFKIELHEKERPE